jgi:hypothetical protein
MKLHESRAFTQVVCTRRAVHRAAQPPPQFAGCLRGEEGFLSTRERSAASTGIRRSSRQRHGIYSRVGTK